MAKGPLFLAHAIPSVSHNPRPSASKQSTRRNACTLSPCPSSCAGYRMVTFFSPLWRRHLLGKPNSELLEHSRWQHGA